MGSPARGTSRGTGPSPRRGSSHSAPSTDSEGDPPARSPAKQGAHAVPAQQSAGTDDLASLIASGAGICGGHHDLSDFAPAGALAVAPGLAAKVLVLNKLYMAIRVISARRAFCLLMQQAAEVVHVEDGQYISYDFETWAELSEIRKAFEAERFDWVRTVRVEIAVPKVIRLLGYDRLPDQHVKLNRRNLFARDRNQCQYCGRHFPTSELSIDHVMPRAQGGADTWENLVCACVRCNARKGGRTPDQAATPLIRKPVRPKRNPMITVRLGQQRYESWKTFLDNAYWSVELR